MVYNVEKLGTINIGRHGENLARVIKIDVSSMLKKWPDATITLLVKRNKDEAYYVAVTELVDGILYWPVTRAETAVPGNGLIEIRATCGETIAKSITGFIRVSAALTGNETEPPETAKSWVDQVIEYGNEATQAAIKAKEEADRLSGINAKAITLPAGSEATVTVEEDCLVYGIPRGDKGDPGTDATVTPESIKDALGYTPADDAAMAGKLTEPATGLAVGKYLRVAAIDESGHAVLEAVDANVGGLSTEPSLWPAWTSDEQAAARERMGIEDLGAWEDIVTVTAEESTSVITVDKDSNGNPFALSQMICELIMPAESVAKSRTVYFGTKAHALSAFTRVQTSTNATVKSFALAYAKIVSGKIMCESAISASFPNGYQECTNKSIYNGYAYHPAESFNAISVFTYSDAFPAGCTLIIRGIRI